MNEKSDFLRAGAFPTLLANSGGPLDDNSIRTVSNFIREGHCTRFVGRNAPHIQFCFTALVSCYNSCSQVDKHATCDGNYVVRFIARTVLINNNYKRMRR